MPDLSRVMATLLAANIKTLRMREGPTQVEFAEALGVSQGTIARWESGSKPEYEHIVKMAAMAGVSVPEFTGQILTSERPQFVGSTAGVLFLPVQLPSEAALTEMFEGLLETMPANLDSAAIAQKLAQLLPGALSRTVSHAQAETWPSDQPRPPEGAGEGRPKSDPAPTR